MNENNEISVPIITVETQHFVSPCYMNIAFETDIERLIETFETQSIASLHYENLHLEFIALYLLYFCEGASLSLQNHKFQF